MQHERIHCNEHDEAYVCVICQHLLDGSGTGFFTDDNEAEQQWPTAWCADCERHIASVSDWENENFWQRLRVVCHHCYESIRERQLRR